MTIRSGRLRDMMTIESISVTEDLFGKKVDTWSTVAVRSCSIEQLNGREFYGAEGEQNIDSFRIRFRYEKGLLNTKLRLVDNRRSPADIYDIEDIINPRNLDRELICMCKRR